jgi:hypothetical protein
MGNPTFRIAIGESLLTDTWKPGQGRPLSLTSSSHQDPPPSPPPNPSPSRPEKPETVTYDIN